MNDAARKSTEALVAGTLYLGHEHGTCQCLVTLLTIPRLMVCNVIRFNASRRGSAIFFVVPVSMRAMMDHMVIPLQFRTDTARIELVWHEGTAPWPAQTLETVALTGVLLGNNDDETDRFIGMAKEAVPELQSETIVWEHERDEKRNVVLLDVPLAHVNAVRASFMWMYEPNVTTRQELEHLATPWTDEHD